jgi:hypothetical protein
MLYNQLLTKQFVEWVNRRVVSEHRADDLEKNAKAARNIHRKVQELKLEGDDINHFPFECVLDESRIEKLSITGSSEAALAA